MTKTKQQIIEEKMKATLEEFDQQFGEYAKEVAFKNWKLLDTTRRWIEFKTKSSLSEAIDETREEMRGWKLIENKFNNMEQIRGWNEAIVAQQKQDKEFMEER
jgi:hypothetical protein